jgi:hypothetical protein
LIAFWIAAALPPPLTIVAPAGQALRVDERTRHHRLRLSIDALGLVAPMIDPRRQAGFAQRLIRHLGPALANP